MVVVIIYVSVKLCRRIGLPEHTEGILISQQYYDRVPKLKPSVPEC